MYKLKNKRLALIVIAIATCALVFGCVGFLTVQATQSDKKATETIKATPDEVETYTSSPSSTVSETETTAPSTEAETEAETEPVTEKPTKKPTEAPTEKPTQKPTEKPTNPTQNISVNTDNILFIGNSLVEGIRLCTYTNNIYLSEGGISLDGLKNNIYSQIPLYSCKTVIIGMGTNELGSYTESHFKSSYKELINQIKSSNPNADIVCMSIPPVYANRSSYDSLFNNYNVQIYNEYIKDIADETQTYYLDNSSFFGDTLNSNWTGDGIHLTGYVYADWYDFIVSQIS